MASGSARWPVHEVQASAARMVIRYAASIRYAPYCMMRVAARVAACSNPNASSAATLTAPVTVSAPAGDPWRRQVRVSNAPAPPVSRPRANSSRAAAFRQAN